MNRTIYGVIAACVLSAACGENTLPVAGPSPMPAVTKPASGVTMPLGVQAADNPRYSCPTGGPSFILDQHGAVDMNGSNRAALRWTDARVEHYQIQIDRQAADNTWVQVANYTTEKTSLDVVLKSEGIYQARIRSQSCALAGPWVTSPTFSTNLSDGGPFDPPVVPPVTPPVVPPVIDPCNGFHAQSLRCDDDHGPGHDKDSPGFPDSDHRGGRGHGGGHGDH